MRLTKIGLIEFTAARAEQTFTVTNVVVNAFLQNIQEALKRGDTVTISGFGKFYVHERKASLGVDPRDITKRMARPARRSPKFTAGEPLREFINNNA